MKKKYLLLFLSLVSLSSYSQEVVANRMGTIEGTLAYDAEGTAFLEELDNGAFQVRLSEDFSTDRGPDVTLFLTPDDNFSSGSVPDRALEIENISDLGHFSGVLIEPVIIENLEEYNHLFFFCVQFGNLLWAHVDFSETTHLTTCLENLTATTAWIADTNICPTDGDSNELELLTTIDMELGANYAFLITDENEILQEVVTSDYYDFEGSGTEIQHVYGVSYNGILNPVIGANRAQTTASICYQHSGEDFFLAVSKTDCPTGIEEIKSGKATLFPQPVSDVLNFELPSGFKADNVIIYTLQGEKVLEPTIRNAQTSVSSLESGSYIIEFNGDNRRLSQKLLIQK